MYNQKKKISAKIIYVGILIIISIILTIPSMYAIKNAPGNGFSTEMGFIATTLLVFGLWFLGILSIIWFIRFLINLGRLKKNSSSTNTQMLLEKRGKDIKSLSTLRKVIIGILNVACIYLSILYSIVACTIFMMGAPLVLWLIFVSVNACIIILALACGISDFTMMIKLKHNPYNQKALSIREKGKKYFKTLVILYILLYVLLTIGLVLSSH